MKRRRPGSGLGGLEDPVADSVVGEAGNRLQLLPQEFEGGRILLADGGEANLAARAAAEIGAFDEGADLAPRGLAVEAGGSGDRADVAAGGIARRERGGDV